MMAISGGKAYYHLTGQPVATASCLDTGESAYACVCVIGTQHLPISAATCIMKLSMEGIHIIHPHVPRHASICVTAAYR